MRFVVLLACFSASLDTAALAAADVTVRNAQPGAPCIAWGVAQFERAISQGGEWLQITAPTAIEVSIDPAQIEEKARKPEGYRIVARPGHVAIAGYDAAGAMYGSLDFAQRVRDRHEIPAELDVADAPAMSLRGTCILLMKLGLYDYPVTPTEFPFFYDKGLWIQYLDFLAANRFNYIAFWNGHPFDYFVKLDRYPEAQDGLDPGLLERNHEMLLWLGTEAQRRNIWLMFEFYNIHTSVYFAKAHYLPEHGIGKPTDLLRDYTGYCIERFVGEFPNIGLYICPGEALQLEYTPGWINDVIFAAVKRTGKTPPIMIRSWGIDLEHMKQVAGNYPRLYTERKFNVEMIAGTEIDPENADWAKVAGNHVVNIHCLGNLEPFRWSPPSYIQRCIQSSMRAGATGLHLYPRKAWRWPYGCDRLDKPQLQWERDWLWFEAWGRYAWNAQRDPDSEKQYWISRLAAHFGSLAGEHILAAYEAGADVLPGIQRLVWLGNDNHTVVSAGILLDQLRGAKGIPFLKIPEMVRIPDYIEALKHGKKIEGVSPVEFLDRKAAEAEQALGEARHASDAATRNREEAESIRNDAAAVLFVARFYHDKVQAAIAQALAEAGVNPSENARECASRLEASVADFRDLTTLTETTYESISDVPAWNPTKSLPCPYHWKDILPVLESELDAVGR